MKLVQNLALEAVFGRHASRVLSTILAHNGGRLDDDYIQEALIWGSRWDREHIEAQAGNWVRTGVRRCLIDNDRREREAHLIVLPDGTRAWTGDNHLSYTADPYIIDQYFPPDDDAAATVERWVRTEQGWMVVYKILDPLGQRDLRARLYGRTVGARCRG